MFASSATQPPDAAPAWVEWSLAHDLVIGDPELPDRPSPVCTPANTRPSGWLALELDHGTVDASVLADDALVEAIVGFDRVSSWAAARQSRLLAEFARRRPGDDPIAVQADKACSASRYAPDEIGLALKLARGTAMLRLFQSTRLDAVLTGTRQAWEDGLIDVGKIRAICEVTGSLTVEQAVAVEQRVLGRAGEQSLGQLRAALARAVIAVDPEGAAERHRVARKDRRVVLGDERDGMASLWALLSAPDAQSCFQWLTRLARGLGKDDPRLMDARRADLLTELLTGQLVIVPADEVPADEVRADEVRADEVRADEPTGDRVDPTAGPRAESDAGTSGTGPAEAAGADALGPEAAVGAETAAEKEFEAAAAGMPGAACGCGATQASGLLRRPITPGKPLVQVVMPFGALTGADDGPCELVGYGAISAEQAREIAADAVWRRLVTDPLSGALLDCGRTTYHPPAALADLVRGRDVYCRFPLCRRRAVDAELDHALAWSDGGVTSDENLYAGCLLHHTLKHHGGWVVAQHPDGRITWTTPTGHRYTSEPHDYRSDPTPPARAARPPNPARSGTSDDPVPVPVPARPLMRLADLCAEPLDAITTGAQNDPPPF